MPTSNANATWQGGLKEGKGSFQGESGSISGDYSFASRFVGNGGTNPEELLAAAHAACFSMALSAQLEGAGITPEQVQTRAACTIEKAESGFRITTMRLSTRVRAPGLDDARLQEIAGKAKTGCPVSQALTGLQIEMDATLE